MEALFLMLAAFAGYILMYRLYGRRLGAKVFKLSTKALAPAVEFEDGVDFVPTKKEIIFGHHFTSIAGTGPIVGPAIAVIWGWVPAMIWIFLGSIFMGAAHDLGALVLSMRNQGKSISEIAGKYISPRIKIIFFSLVFLDLLIITAIFGLVIAVIFEMFPSSVLPVWLEIPIAIIIGRLIYRRGGSPLFWGLAALGAMYATVVLGVCLPFNMPSLGGFSPTGVWTVLLLLYAFFASILPVTTLLQPRDFINSHQLMVALALLVLGVLAASFAQGGLNFVAPAVQASPRGAPPMLPFIFITIACGAVSGFHALVSSGTSAKQVRSEKDALFVGYGGMLTEAALSTLVVVAVAAGVGLGYASPDGNFLTGSEAWTAHYSSWGAAAGLGAKVRAFVVGAANIISSIGLPKSVSLAVMGVLVASFAGTTMDTAARIERYALSELLGGFMPVFNNKYFSTAVVIILAGALAFSSGADGKGALALWPLFGGVNQVLAALTLMVVTVYLRKSSGPNWLLTGIPALFLSLASMWAIFINQDIYEAKGDLLLQILNQFILLAAAWIAIEGAIKLFRSRPGR